MKILPHSTTQYNHHSIQPPLNTTTTQYNHHSTAPTTTHSSPLQPILSEGAVEESHEEHEARDGGQDGGVSDDEATEGGVEGDPHGHHGGRGLLRVLHYVYAVDALLLNRDKAVRFGGLWVLRKDLVVGVCGSVVCGCRVEGYREGNGEIVLYWGLWEGVQ